MTWLTIDQLAVLCGVSKGTIYYHHKLSHVPRGDVQVGLRHYYSEKLAAEVKDYFAGRTLYTHMKEEK